MLAVMILLVIGLILMSIFVTSEVDDSIYRNR
jgi:hypothetical protein